MKTEKEIRDEIGAVMRQITATVTFLPLLETPCKLEVLYFVTRVVLKLTQKEDYG